MKENKLTPEEIKKALECCASGKNCEECSLNCKAPTSKDILDLINRQQAEIEDARICVSSYINKYKSAVKTAKELQRVIAEKEAEIERLTINMNAFGLGMKQEKERADTIRAEAIKEFAEKLKNKKKLTLWGIHNHNNFFHFIDNLVKEMVGEQE
jgi:hypothetical protein